MEVWFAGFLRPIQKLCGLGFWNITVNLISNGKDEQGKWKYFLIPQCPHRARVLELEGTAELSILLLQHVSNGVVGQRWVSKQALDE